MYTDQNDPLSQQINVMNEGFKKNPALAQKTAAIPPETMETLIAKRVVNEFARQKRQLQEESFVGRAGDPNTTVNDNLKTQGVQLAQDVTNLEAGRAKAAGDVGRRQQMDQQNALSKLVAANRKPSPGGGIGNILNNPNAAPSPNRGGVPTLGANNMRGMPPGGITPNAQPMRAAQGGVVKFVEGGNEELETEEQTPADRTYALINKLREDEKAEAKAEAARITASFEKEERGGVFSNDAIQRMIDFGGARTLSEGIRQSSSAANMREAAERKELNDALAAGREGGNRLSTAAMQAAISSGQLNLQEDKLAQEDEQFKLDLEYKKFNFDETQRLAIDKLDVNEAQFKQTLAETVQDRELKERVEASKLGVDRAYKEAVVALSNQENRNDAKGLVVRLAAEKNEYIQIMQTVISDSGLDPDEQEIEMVKLGEDYTAAILALSKEIELKPGTEVQMKVQEMTNKVVNGKKRGGIASLAR